MSQAASRADRWWSGTGSNCRPSAFQGVYHPESAYLEKAPAAQLTRIDAADRLFSVPLTRITSVPECAVPSVGFLWGPATVSPTCGDSVGSREHLDLPRKPARAPGYSSRWVLVITLRITQGYRAAGQSGGNSAPHFDHDGVAGWLFAGCPVIGQASAVLAAV